jgi:hypothetical protein
MKREGASVNMVRAIRLEGRKEHSIKREEAIG